MIALTLTAPLVGFGLILFMQWLEKRTLTDRSPDFSEARRRRGGRHRAIRSARGEAWFVSAMALVVLATVTLMSAVLVR